KNPALRVPLIFMIRTIRFRIVWSVMMVRFGASTQLVVKDNTGHIPLDITDFLFSLNRAAGRPDVEDCCFCAFLDRTDILTSFESCSVPDVTDVSDRRLALERGDSLMPFDLYLSPFPPFSFQRRVCGELREDDSIGRTEIKNRSRPTTCVVRQ